MKRTGFLLSLVMAISLLLGACGAEPATPTPAATTQVTAAPSPTSLPVAAASPTAAPTPAMKGELIVSAAVSLSDALKEIKAAFEAENPGAKINCNLGASGDLQLQIEQGAPADLFLSAGKKQMDALESRGLLLEGTRRDIAANALVLIVPKSSALGIIGFSDLTKPEVQKLSIGNPATVPAGDYAQQTLQKLGLWDAIQGKLIQGENVRQVLTYVETGEVDAGLVYSTDARTASQATVVAEAPAESHKPIIYPGAVIKSTKQPDLAKAFLTYVAGPKGQGILARYGFRRAT
ncbi:MAG: molybdate ABC transporter substrate-binding protein [Chloroflexi bacterium]|nr:molybdate ABC transporter substrate-binding protein [Chloroflexota bacterium]